MKTNRFFTKLLAVMMTLALCSGMVKLICLITRIGVAIGLTHMGGVSAG